MKTLYFRIVLIIGCLIVLGLPKWVENKFGLWVKEQTKALLWFLLGRKRERIIIPTDKQWQELRVQLNMNCPEAVRFERGPQNGDLIENDSGVSSFYEDSIYGILGNYSIIKEGDVIEIRDQYDWHADKPIGLGKRIAALAKWMGFPIEDGNIKDKFFSQFGQGYVHVLRIADPTLFGTPWADFAASARAEVEEVESVWQEYERRVYTEEPAFERRVTWRRVVRRKKSITVTH